MRKKKKKSSESKSVGADTTIPKQRKKCSEGGCGSSIRSFDHLFTLSLMVFASFISYLMPNAQLQLQLLRHGSISLQGSGRFGSGCVRATMRRSFWDIQQFCTSSTDPPCMAIATNLHRTRAANRHGLGSFDFIARRFAVAI